MPQRATSTSYGGIKGNRPASRGVKGRAGRKPLVYHERMRLIADRAAEASRWEALIADDNPDHELFFKAFNAASDRGYGKPAQAVDVTSAGEKLAGLVMMPHEDAP